MKSNLPLPSIAGHLGLFVLKVALGLLVFEMPSNHTSLLSREIDPYARIGVPVSLLVHWVWGKFDEADPRKSCTGQLVGR